MAQYLIGIGICLLGGLMMSRLAKKISLPAVTAYLVAGLLLGPFVIGKLGIPGIGFTSLEEAESLGILSQAALGFIAFAIGNEFRLTQLKKMGKQAILVGIFESVITTVVVDIALITFHFLNPDLLPLPIAITLGAIAAATAPAATLMVVKQYKAEGLLTKLLLLVVALDDAVGLMLFSVSFGIARALESGVVDILVIILEPIVEITLSLGLGALMGYLLHRTEKFFHSRSKRLSISVAYVLLAVGISLIDIQVGGIHTGFSLLLVCMMMGTVFCNVCNFSEELMERVDGWTGPISVLFFVISGAELDLSVISKPLILLIGIVYIIFRSLGKYFGAGISCKLNHCDAKISKNLGITLLPQAGVALGMAQTAMALDGGPVIRNVVLFSVLVYELIGPVMTKGALMRAGEINPEGATSARVSNS